MMPKWLNGLIVAYSAYLAGGALRSLFDGTEINDYDIYFKNREDYEAFIEAVEQMRNTPVLENTYKDMKTYRIKGIQLQVIAFRNSETIKDLLDTFDYTATRFGYDGKYIYFDRYAYQDAAAKKLVIYKVQNPLSMIKRALKYANKGYHVSNPTIKKLFESLEEKHPEVVIGDYDGADEFDSRILVTNQSTATINGIYNISTLP